MVVIKKLCKICGLKHKYANTNFCFSCFKAREKSKKDLKEKNKLERKLASKGYTESLRKTLHKKAWTLMSEWVRTKDANLDGYVYCYTCGAIKHYKETDAGHFHHDRLDFDERNLKPQCTKCNRHLHGRLDVYAINLLKDYGSEWLLKLQQDAVSYNKYDVAQLQERIIDLKLKLNKLK